MYFDHRHMGWTNPTNKITPMGDLQVDKLGCKFKGFPTIGLKKILSINIFGHKSPPDDGWWAHSSKGTVNVHSIRIFVYYVYACMLVCMHMCPAIPYPGTCWDAGQNLALTQPSKNRVDSDIQRKCLQTNPNQSLSCRIRKKPANRLLNELTRLYRPVIKHGNGKSSIGYIQPLSGHLSMWKKLYFNVQ